MLPLFGLTSDASIKYHIWLGHIGMTLFTAHGILYIIYWAVTHRFSQVRNIILLTVDYHDVLNSSDSWK